MGNVNNQQLWVTGSRFYFQRDPIATVVQPIIDMGVMKVVASPNFEITEIECDDPDGGIAVTIDKAITKIEETYELTFGNLNLDNLSLLFLSDPAIDIAQPAETRFFKHRGIPGRLLKALDADYDAAVPGDFVQGVLAFLGVADGKTTSAGGSQPVAVQAVASIASQLIKITGVDLTTELKSGDKVVLCGLTASADDGVFTLSIDSVLNTGDTDITVTETITDQGAPGGSLRPTTLIKGTDWEDFNLERGLLRFIDGGLLTVDSDVNVCYSTRAITGEDRRIVPLTITGLINGKGLLVWGRENNAFQTARIMRVALIPGTPTFQVEDYSTAVFNATVLTDVTSAEPAGRLDYWLGALPDKA